jgi:cystathionine gamma-synthase
MHSLTKGLSGHSDIIGGALVGSRERIDRARSFLKVLGGCMDPHAAFLVLRGLKTVHLRVARQCENALALARHFEGHARVLRVIYPGLPSHPGHEVARRQMSSFGMVSLVLEDSPPPSGYDRLEWRAASLGESEC